MGDPESVPGASPTARRWTGRWTCQLYQSRPGGERCGAGWFASQTPSPYLL